LVKKNIEIKEELYFSNMSPVFVRLVYKLFTEFFNISKKSLKNKIKVHIYYNLNYHKSVEEILTFGRNL